MERNRKRRADDKTCRREQEVRMKEGWSDRQTGGYELTWQVEEKDKKKQNQSEVERWNRGNRHRNRVSKRTSESQTAGRWNISFLVRSVLFHSMCLVF